MRRWILLPVLALLTVHTARAQEAGRVAGTVTSQETGRPVAGATVTIVGTRLGTIANAQGAYTITGVAPGARTVQARMLGYTPTSQPVSVVAGQTATANFALKTAPAQLSGVVVVGYGTQSRREIAGAVSTLDSAAIHQVTASNPLDAIKGRIPGVDITASSFEPGAADAIRIRGTRSISASNNPLYVVDGVPITGDLRDIDANSIESIEVLKDASAAAVYGSRGANGVIMITTKKGSGVRTEFTLNSTYGVSNVRREVPMMTGQQFANFRREAYRNGSVAAAAAACANYMTNPAPCDVYALDPTMRANLAAGVNTDWQQQMLRTGQLGNTQLGFSGGTPETRFRAGFGYLNQTGIAITQDYQARTLSFNVSHDHRKLNLQLGIQGAQTHRDVGLGAVMWDETLFNPALGRVRDSTGAMVFLPTEDGLLVNPVMNARNVTRQIDRTNLLGTLTGSYELLNGLRIHSNFGPQYTANNDGQMIGIYTVSKRGQGAPDATLRQTTNTNYTFSNFLDFDRTFGERHHLQATALYEVASFRSVYDSAAALALPFDNQLWYNLGTGSTPTLNGVFSQTALRSYMGRVNYTLLNRYTFSLTGREDGSSVLAAGHKFSFFPAAAFAWQVGDESFMQRVRSVSDLKLRVSYGRVGNSAISAYQTLGLLNRTWYATTNNYLVGFQPGAIPNPNLKWETTDKFNVGVDYGLFGQRIYGSIDAYRENTHDLLLPRALPYSTGYTSVLQNVGATKNVGLEIGITTENLKNWHKLSWTTDFNYSANRNQIVSLQSGLTADVGNLRWVGQPINVYYDYKYVGLWQTADSALAKQECGCKVGDIRVADLDGDGKITAADRTIIGRHYNNPLWQGSMNNRLTYGALDFSFLTAARIGYLINDSFTGAYDGLAGRFNNIQTNYWTPENPTGTDPRPSTNGLGPFAGARNYKDGSFVRVRDITLGYTIDSNLARRLYATRARLYVRAQDPFIFTSYKGWDPEAGFNAGNGNSQQSQADVGGPAYRTFLFGIDFGF